ncbi:MAG TPA: cation diffusion facilitator family transporter [Anaerolineales bacterium]|nr:cation diffusion facilitator family transporter [Anaerolineales bacterium]
MSESQNLQRFAWISVAGAVITIFLKLGAYWLTGSVGLLSDALESLVNLAGALMSLLILGIAARPADEEHAYGHGKAEYFSSGFEGGLILIAALGIAYTAIPKFFNPSELEQLGLGLAVAFAASAINLIAATVLLRASRKYRSITLEASSHHLMTDVWTSVGVAVGVGLVWLTGWKWLDPLVAILVALNIVVSGFQIVRKSVLGLMDTALPTDELKVVRAVLDKHQTDEIQYHALRTRQSGTRRFVSVHILVPGAWSVDKGHHLLERIEEEIRSALPATTVFTHLESLQDPTSWADADLDRGLIA